MDKLGGKQTQYKNGFTIVELLVVIVVIGILASITIVAYNGIQTRARTAALTSGIQSVEKAFRLMAIEQSRSTWWRDTSSTDPIYTGSPNNPNLSDIIANTTMKSYLQRVPSGSSTNTWRYDNDGDSRVTTACQAAGTEGSGWTGVVLVVDEVSTPVLLEIDKQLDDGNVYCGKIRASSSAQTGLLYQLSWTPNLE